ncbi:Fe2+-enterobactin ABC transporter substrate-binding protein [Brucella inopinata]|uniref:Fe2+-enterobactin ABC transporter substrate-binding protein n=1 Tax=Brucella inopinata TaxID=1218315 RepID=A0AAW7B4R6_9HYPH|nr:Fe2+-enterobactin ABC transporter substrate-binding protein [Brucella inopinata]KEY05914.1 antibiotic ABC transporter substrate-binding protein [Brucella suis bv. 4 str. 40]MDL2332820.1 Fe2+-enterobactin ABC transporter substrate-binding protein [Brucella inopinata]
MKVADNRQLFALFFALSLMVLAPISIARADEAWPRNFANADGSTTVIPKKPQRIFSTSVSTTGTLLAIGAPVVASASAANGKFFAQWDSVAKERGVENAWPAGGIDLETVYATQPDLIVVAISGAGSAKDQLTAFRQIAPTILVDDGSETWQALAQTLGKATGLEKEAAATVSDFDAYVAAAKAKIKVPEGTADIISFNGAGQANPIARVGGPHASLLASLGFTIEDPNPAWHTQAASRKDFVWAPYENLIDLKSTVTFLLRVNDSGAAAFLNDPFLANQPSVKSRQVYGLGVNSFRIDNYSARQIVDDIVKKFGA